jgi:high affinity Mn2+ porin
MKKYLILIFALVFLIQQDQAQPVISRMIGNEKLGKKDSVANWTIHAQLSTVYQYHPSFQVAYSGPSSLSSKSEGALSLTTTLFLGRKLWKGAAFYVNPEITGGQGLSGGHGIAGFPNGEIYRVGNPSPTPFFARMYIQQIITLGKSDYDVQSSDINRLAGKLPSSRVVISLGKFCLADFFDGNNFNHDARTQFLNWSLMANGSWDFAADTRGYTSGLVVEFIKPLWAFRFSFVQVPKIANGLPMDYQINKANAETAEFEKDWKYKGHTGAARLTGFINFTRAPYYKDAISAKQSDDTARWNYLVSIISSQTTWNTFGGIKYGFGISIDQDLGYGLGVFARGNWSDGHSAAWAFTDIDNNTQLGILMKGTLWKRPSDNFGIAGAINGISPVHRQYLELGGYSFIIGDGRLNYGPETILEVFYNVQLANFLFISPDYQFVANPGYNKDRGPVHVPGIRVHLKI